MRWLTTLLLLLVPSLAFAAYPLDPTILEVRTGGAGIVQIVFLSDWLPRLHNGSDQILPFTSSEWTVDLAEATTLGLDTQVIEELAEQSTAEPYAILGTPYLGYCLNEPNSWCTGTAAPDPDCAAWGGNCYGYYNFPIKVHYNVYMDMSTSFAQGQTYDIVTPFGSTSWTYDEDATRCSAVKVNQDGYASGSTLRFGIHGIWMGDGGPKSVTAPTFRVKLAKNKNVVLSGTAGAEKDDTDVDANKSDPGPYLTSGEYVRRLSIEALPAGGPYYIVIDGCGRSPEFVVGGPGNAEYHTARGYYHQRCGTALTSEFTPFTRDTCHEVVYDTRTSTGAAECYYAEIPCDSDKTCLDAGVSTNDWCNFVIQPTFINVNTSLETPITITGGHHDAGDYDRRPEHSAYPHEQLSIYETWPENYHDNQYRIPESRNRIPDILDEAAWAVKLWMNLQIMDGADQNFGAVRSGTERGAHPGYGTNNAARETIRCPSEGDTYCYGTYEPIEFVTTYSAGHFAHLSRLIQPWDPALATDLAARAQLAWNWSWAKNGDTPGRNARWMYASLQMYLLTGDSSYHTYFIDIADDVVRSNPTPGWPNAYDPSRPAVSIPQTHQFVSYLLDHGRATDATLLADLKSILEDMVTTPGVGNDMFVGVVDPDDTAYPWLSNKDLTGLGILASSSGYLTTVYAYAHRFNAGPLKQGFLNKVSINSDWALGVNPLGTVLITGVGETNPQGPLHLDSFFTKYGIDDGVSVENHAGVPIGVVPGLPHFGISGYPGTAPHLQTVWLKRYPAAPTHASTDMPRLRRWADGWSLVWHNEMALTNMRYNLPMFTFLTQPQEKKHLAGGTVVSGGSF